MNSLRFFVWAGLSSTLVPLSVFSVGMVTDALASIPLIRDAPVDLQGALANDFVVTQQTPYSTGRNEIVSVSPSTGTEQVYEVSLPDSGPFQLYESSFRNVEVSDSERLIESGTTLSDAQIQASLSRFSIDYNGNQPAVATLGDGATATFDGSLIVVRSPAGEVVETISLEGTSEQSLAKSRMLLDSSIQRSDNRHNGLVVGQLNEETCQQEVRDRFYELSVEVNSGAITLEDARSDYGKLFNWIMTFGAKALENATVPNSRNLTFQSVACQPPVVCNEPQTYDGASEIRTDLFRLPKGRNQLVRLEREFYTIPDQMELYYNGEIIFSVGPASGYDEVEINSLPDDSDYVGVKIIGNTDENTRWWYTILCSSEPVQ